jgi:high-affinity iron transporter
MIGAFYGLEKNVWSGAELIWEGVFAIVASLVISVMGAGLLRISKLQAKWRGKLARALNVKAQKDLTIQGRCKIWCKKYAMFILPFITVLREGLEAVVFIGGVSLGLSASSIPLAVICGLTAGTLVGYLIYKYVYPPDSSSSCSLANAAAVFRGSMFAPIHIFLIVSTCLLYLVAAGLLSRGVWYLEANTWNGLTGGDAAENGNGPGSYDIRQSVWHVNCCSPSLNGGGGWGVFNALLGWQNSATYGSVISYNLYWLAVIVVFIAMRFRERNGRWPLMKAPSSGGKKQMRAGSDAHSSEDSPMPGKGGVAVKCLEA